MTVSSQQATHARDTDLGTYVDEIVELLPRIEQLVPTQDRIDRDRTGAKPTKRHVYPAPWNEPAGHLVTTIHFQARSLETDLTLLLFGHAKYRGNSGANTIKALRRLPVLVHAACEAGHAEHSDVHATVMALARWPRDMRALLDELHSDEQPWTKAPGDLCCPHCEHRLWLRPGWTDQPDSADVVCRRCGISWPPTAWVGLLQHAE